MAFYDKQARRAQTNGAALCKRTERIFSRAFSLSFYVVVVLTFKNNSIHSLFCKFHPILVATHLLAHIQGANKPFIFPSIHPSPSSFSRTFNATRLPLPPSPSIYPSINTSYILRLFNKSQIFHWAPLPSFPFLLHCCPFHSHLFRSSLFRIFNSAI